MRIVSLFSGIGGFDLGLERAGGTVVAQVENDPFCQRVLERRWSDVHRVADVRAYCVRSRPDAAESGQRDAWRDGWPIDLLAGGFPCQDLSVAGKRAGLRGARSGLFAEYVRIAHALAPTFGLVENVPGLVSSAAGRDMWTVVEGLRECWPVVGWRILDSQYFGVAQRRRRVFLVGGPTEARVAEILALTEGGGGDLAAGGQAGTDIAYALAAGAGGSKFGSGRDAQDTFVTEPVVAALDLADTLSVGANQTTGFPGDLGPAIGSSIRRLTPLECERLQGFPDGWTCLCTPLSAYAADPDDAALACRCPDSPRYQALGNAVTVPVIQWLGARLARMLA